MKYTVNTTCYWGGRYYKVGEVVEIGNAEPPKHFTPMDAPKQEQPNKRAQSDAEEAAPKAKARKGRGA